MIRNASLVDLLEFDAKKREPTMWSSPWLKVLFLIGLVLFFVSCASRPNKEIVYEADANPSEEINLLQKEMAHAETEQIAVLAPRSYNKANTAMETAKSLESRSSTKERVLRQLGRARSYFEEAKLAAARSQQELPGVLDARENAVIAGAVLYHPQELLRADRRLMAITNQINRGATPRLTVEEKAALQEQYLDVELRSIKSARLADAQALINEAKRRGARRYSPKTLDQAEAKLKEAELKIETDRHNDKVVTEASNEAMNEARRLTRITDLSRQAGGQKGDEDLALAVVERDEKIAALQRLTQEEALRAQRSEAQLNAARAQMQQQQETRIIRERRQQTQQTLPPVASGTQAPPPDPDITRQRVDEAYQLALNSFSPEEAEVFRQGDNLVLRMRVIQFPVNDTEIPAAALGTLDKVGDIVRTLKAERVIVEGHTDATGDPDHNLQLSEERAEAVTEYLQGQLGIRQTGGAGDGRSEVRVEARGYGYEHPLTSNRTPQGRAVNRRVDIVIAP